MMKQTSFIVAIVTLILVLTNVVSSDVPQLISFQGKLYDSEGNPLTGEYAVLFRMYHVEWEGDPLWSDTLTVNCVKGLYNAILGQTTPINLDFNGQYWLSVQVTGDDELLPRYRLVSVPSAFRAVVADSAVRVGWTNISQIPEGFADGIDDVGAEGGVSQIDAGTGITVTHPTGPTAIVSADIGTESDQVAAGDHNHDADYVNEGQVNSITSDMIVNGTIQEEDLSFTSGSGDGHSLDASDGSPTDAIYVDDAGNVGLGTKNPQNKLHISEGDMALDYGQFIHFYHDNGGHYGIGSVRGHDEFVIGNTAGGGISFNTGTFPGFNARRMTISDNGNIGIGDSRPGRNLDILHENDNGGIEINRFKTTIWSGLSYENNGSDNWFIGVSPNRDDLIFRNNGSKNCLVLEEDTGNIGINTSDPEYSLDVAGAVNLNKDVSGGSVALRVNGAEALWYNGTYFSWGYGGTVNYFAKNVGINTNAPAYTLDVAGPAHATSFPTSSDARFKKNVSQLANVLEKVEQIRGVSFEWNERYESLGRSTGHREIGVIAQEVETVFPELVTEWSDDSYKAVDYGRMAGVFIEAIKELKVENETLKRRIEALETKLKE